MATYGSWGDLHPFIALGQAFRARGCEVVLASHPDYRAKVEAAGITFTDYGASRETYVRDLRLPPAEIIKGLSTDHGFMIKRLIAPYLESSIGEISSVIAGCDQVLGSSFAYGAHIAARLHHKPFTTVALQPTVLMSSYDPPKVRKAPFIFAPRTQLGAAFNRLIIKTGERMMAATQAEVRRVYKHHGVKADIGLGGIVSDHQTLALYSPLLGDYQPDFPPNTRIVGFAFYDSETGETPRLEPRLAAFLDDGAAPLVFSLGTAVVYGGEDFYRDAIVAAKTLNLRAVILAGGDSPLLREDFGPDICVVTYAPHSLLFPRARAIIHHAGIGSTAQALRAGRPQLVTPVFGDQFDNARRLKKLGAAGVLNYDHWKTGAAVAHLKRLLADPSAARLAIDAARTVSLEDGAATAAEILTAG
ncbi:glycosyltransferase [Asticcacaulis sp. AC402]|uniref:glycosyltransferase n=1 Tax=Asticcacaulis sp. AC402 TaxID=1282361 RepID=UPI0003C3E45B|nr:nucleotide disphospho-sugar-binding domain-containing protein [Asticcacaulis sp. AC402]ESQ74798.1 hypothetical protein ABAC402_12900 [Asticcacaulis sp. AC402]